MNENSVFEQLALWNPHDTHPKETLPLGKERGAVYTRRETVDFILNLAGYFPDRPLHHYTLLNLHSATAIFSYGLSRDL
jgi:hypothetical protein